MKSLHACLPRYSTPRTNRPTKGHEVARVAEMLGVPLMPHQRHIVDVALEQENGKPAYSEVCVTIPRQSGKSILCLAVMVWSALQGERRRVAYTAQTGSDARKKLVLDYIPAVENSDFGSLTKMKYANGSESITFANGSRIEPLPSTLTAGHGMTLAGGAFIDEAFADIDSRREQALLPAMVTCDDAQLWVVSTAGTEQSTYLQRKVAMGRQAVTEGSTSGVAYFEWSADDEASPDDEDVYYSCMPALGHTVKIDKIRHARQTMPDAEFRRAYLNQWTKTDERVIPEVLWNEVQTDKRWPNEGLTFGVDVTLDRARASIVVADLDGVVELVDNRDGTEWITNRVKELLAAHGGRVVIDAYSPAGNFIDYLTGVEVVKYSTRDAVSAANGFYDAVMQNNGIAVRPHEALTNAVAFAQKKPMGSGWLWARTDPAADLSPLHATCIAWHCATVKPKIVKRPMIL